MSLARIPDFSLPALDADRVPFHADPVLAAIERHSEAWSVFQVALEGEASETADAETYDALHALLGTPCATRAGMLCLIRHLRWWLAEEAPNAGAYSTVGGVSAWAVAQAREADLSKALGVEPIQRIPLALPSGRLRGPVLDLRPVLPPVPALPRLGRALAQAGELLAAVTVVAGGMGLVGLATLL